MSCFLMTNQIKGSKSTLHRPIHQREIPDQDRPLTGAEWLELYGAPLASTDLLRGRIKVGCTVQRVTWLPQDGAETDGAEMEGAEPDAAETDSAEGSHHEDAEEEVEPSGEFELLLEADGETETELTDVVIDASGICGPELDLQGIDFELDDQGAPVGVAPWAQGSTLNQQILLPALHYFVLGRKRFGRRQEFSIEDGFEQVRETFSYLGDRSNLDLYAQFRAQQG